MVSRLTPRGRLVGYRYNPEQGTVDIAGFDMASSAKYRNVAFNPGVSFVVDDATGEGASGMRFIEVRGKAVQSTTTSSIRSPTLTGGHSGPIRSAAGGQLMEDRPMLRFLSQLGR